MEETAAIINRVAQSAIVTFDLEELYPDFEITALDMKDWLFHGLILKEADFRQKLEEHNWQQYQDAAVCLHCTADAIVPVWAYMLFAARLQPFARLVFYGSQEEFLAGFYKEALSKMDMNAYEAKRIVIKGCGNKPVPSSAYVDATSIFLPHVKSVMYGETCSTVPVYKAKKAAANAE